MALQIVLQIKFAIRVVPSDEFKMKVQKIVLIIVLIIYNVKSEFPKSVDIDFAHFYNYIIGKL